MLSRRLALLAAALIFSLNAAATTDPDWDGRSPEPRRPSRAALLSPAAAPDQNPSPSPLGLKVAFIGDQGYRDSSRAVLRLIKAEGAELLLIQGDFDYKDNPDAWDAMLTEGLGPDFPVLASLGNHDMAKASGYQDKLRERLTRMPAASCSGDAGMKAACSYRGLEIVFLGYGVAGSRQGTAYLKQELSKMRSPWRVCSWHVPQPAMQVGGKLDGVGWDVYEECRKAGAIIATGHEHSYSRTYLMEEFRTQKVASKANPLRLSPGRSFAFVSGLGGNGIRSQKRSGHWWAHIYTSSQGAANGALFCTFGLDGGRKADCYLKDIQGRVRDPFQLVSDL